MSNPETSLASSDSAAGDIAFVVNRLGYGPRAEEYAAVLKQGVKGWIDEQLNAPIDDEPDIKNRIAKTTWHVKYDASEGKWPAVDEMRPLTSLYQPIDQYWGKIFEQGKDINGNERGFFRSEVIAATMIRAVYSRYQLREVMAQFWHDHFHVNSFSDDHIAAALPAYDREVIRKNTFGNFRAMLEDVATSAAMQYYLSNHSSRAGAANENYARELFELHSFGRENYLNDHYDRWSDVPGAAEGRPAGYIDQDVYEAARAFTGWTVEDGAQVDSGRKLPNTGKFAYVDNWHDGYQKRVLATEFDPFAAAMADGRKTLDLIASHPATAQHMAHKLCVRLAGPNPPAALVARATDSWQKNAKANDQIAQVVRVIVTSPEFMQSRGTKIKRPLALMASFARLLGYDFTPTDGLFNQMANAGQKLFGWPTPAGLPDDNALFLGPNAMRNRWNMMNGMANNAWGNGVPDITRGLAQWGGKAGTGDQVVSEWFRLCGATANAKNIESATLGAGLLVYAPPAPGDDKHLAMAAAIAAMSPEYQIS